MQYISNKYLEFCNYSELKFWDYYTLSHKNQLTANYPLVDLSMVLTQRKKFITIDDKKEYKRCRVQVQGKGVILRDIVFGKEIKTKQQQPCKKDDFLVAEIDAKVGGYGIVPEFLEDAIVSGHYFLFEIDKSLLLPHFLAIVVQQQQFAKQVKSTGSTNYAAIRPYHVLEYKIPLPSLEEQKRLVEVYNRNVVNSERLLLQVNDLSNQIENYLERELGFERNSSKRNVSGGLNFVDYKNLQRWDSDFLLNEVIKGKSKYPLVKFDNLFLSIRNGIPERNYKNEGIRFLKVADIKHNSLSDAETKYVDANLYTPLQKNTLLITRKGTVGNSYFLQEGDYVASSEVFIIKIDESKIDGNYLAEVNQSWYIQTQ